MLDHIQLVERLASSAAEDERNRIALDIHDSLIQPYIALRIGLEAVRQRIAAEHGNQPKINELVQSVSGAHNGSSAGSEFASVANAHNGNGKQHASSPAVNRQLQNRSVCEDITRLCDFADSGVADLRRYIRGLREGGEAEDKLVPSVQRYAKKMQEATGIAVEVCAEREIDVAGRLATEAFQIICEGLSNVRRHTHSPKAIITLNTSKDALTITIANGSDPANVAITPPFVPRSITERAQALGGQVEVQRQMGNANTVQVRIPL
jgi:signal transduction histidine kinase